MTTANELARLERVDLRTVWTTEAQGFTPWLAQPENWPVKPSIWNWKRPGQEERVGPFADILCRDMQDDSLVLIENHWRTDHNHWDAGLQTESG